MCSECTFNGTNNFICESCYAPYVLNEEENKCELCLDTQYYDNSTESCVDNDPSCLRQVDEDTCVLCRNGYYLQNEWCHQQDQNCRENSVTGCEVCNDNTVMTNEGKCTLDQNNCKYQINSNDTKQCMKCNNNYLLDNGQCTDESTCLMIANDRCYDCKENEINENGKCVNYEKDYVEVVTQYNDQYNELQCKEGYILNFEENQCIEKTSENCLVSNGSYC